MSSCHLARAAGRRTRSTVLAALAVVCLSLLGGVGYRALAAWSSSAPSPVGRTSLGHRPPDRLHRDRPGDLPRRREGAGQGAIGVADGAVGDEVTVFDDEYPAVADLDPALLGALRRAATDAAGAGVEVYVNSGWRSPAYQEQLLDEAVSRYGTRAAAARWVATPATSPHVSGKAVDIGHPDAVSWLAEHGAEYGLCQIYRNEPWHFELRPQAVDHGCPARYADPTHDPRMQR